MTFRRLLIGFAAALFISLQTFAADLTGTWKAEFDTQIGVQKYTYEFTADGEKLTGKATYASPIGQGSVELKSVKLDGDQVSFTEELSFEGQALAITYRGKIEGDTLTLVRNVADFANENVVAKRER